MSFTYQLNGTKLTVDTPEQVLKHPQLNPREKTRVLKDWLYEAKHELIADEENMYGDSQAGDLLRKIQVALETL